MSNLRVLDLASNKIKEISGKPFVGLKRLNSFLLSGNLIEKIVKGPFDDLNTLVFLYLRDNNITSIEKGFAKNLNVLDVLVLTTKDDRNELSKFECGIFYGLPVESEVFIGTKIRSLKVGLFRNTTNC